MTDNPFRVGLERLREHGWAQGEPIGRDGRRCIIGALWGDGHTREEDWLIYSKANEDTEHAAFLHVLLREQYPDEVAVRHHCFSDGLWIWNDGPNREQSEVESVLEKAAIRWDEQV